MFNEQVINYFIPYWGLSGGSITKYLGRMGYDCYEPSVAPSGSAWDRACELYAQLAGTVVDYGKEHSERCHHERYGVDYSKNPLMTGFDDSQIVLLGHSFGGATIRLFSEIPKEHVKAGETMSKETKAKLDGRIAQDYASYDMHIDNAYELNEKITTFDDIYYFSYPCSTTKINEKGERTPDAKITESMFMRSSILMSQYSGMTQGGMTKRVKIKPFYLELVQMISSLKYL